jgi:hypothetical protein
MDNKQAEVDEELEEMLHDYQDKLICGLYEAIYDLDQASLDTIMRRQAHTCVAAFLDFTGLPSRVSLEDLADAVRDVEPLGADIERRGDVIRWTGNQRGECACPMVRRGVIRLDPKLCDCSKHWVKHLFDRITHTPVSVEIIETVATGGSACRFEITLR